MKICLLGQFGSGNTGNDGSLEAMLNFLRSLPQTAELVCICSNPELVEKEYNVKSIGISGIVLQGKWYIRFNTLLADIPRRIASLYMLLASLGGVDLMVIPGTGILDDFQETPFGWPFVLFRWCLAARLRSTKIAFVSIGAGPIEHSLSRWFLRSAAKMAHYRSYRDKYSLAYMKKAGLRVDHDYQFPDIAFRLPVPSLPRPEHIGVLTVGVGVMDYRGWSKDAIFGEAINRLYIGKLASFVCWLLEEGHDVRLLTGDERDWRAVRDIIEKVSGTMSGNAMDRITVGRGATLHELMNEMSRVNIVIATRYHNIVCALKLARPTISLGYAQKNDELLAQFGQHYCQHIETFDVEVLKDQTREILAVLDDVHVQLATRNVTVQQELSVQERLLNDNVIDPLRTA
ncbi:polysaccharide pyruvyl transferase family protein [Phyllobacterium myrsinacearum]|uniref:Polysaccharide pyruvyl transferase WcaK-like protein n=1 Tax=Phyllobacterium myrsinacearum TaxID=28101 RepID=A0A839EN80_9HYPH|nr:polysaccharide pyruvyl transferase family protein [Phyllobacterium myrsinacearum]MBA8878896.1 polysaccharide pyruvyl transferase WcaK-like protein [Phyllobacterium myrsinacearum]